MLTASVEPAAPPKRSASEARPRPTGLNGLLSGLAVLGLAVPVALLIAWSHRRWPDPTKSVTIVCGLFAVIVPLPSLAYLLLRRKASSLETLARIGILTIVTVLAGIALYVLGTELLFPADFLSWSESDFVNDILKFRIGYPIYSAQANQESYFYPPSAQILTYFVSALFAHPNSIVCYRIVQMGYTTAAALLAAACVREVLLLAGASRVTRHLDAWLTLCVPVLFLASTNFLTNTFVQNLHNDALAQLVCVFSFWLLVRYARTRSALILSALVLVPAFGFFVKQSLLIWLPLSGLFLVAFDRPRSWPRTFAYVLGASIVFALTIALARRVWGELFFYWTYDTLKRHAISPLRSIQHVLQAWSFFALALLGGIGMNRRGDDRRLLGLWLVSFLLLLTEAYTSGAAWTLSHMGPGSTLATVWFLAAACRYWYEANLWENDRVVPFDYLRAGFVVAIAVFVVIGLNAVRVPLPAAPPDAYRYKADIEREFAGEQSQNVLLDIGTWVYVPNRVIMRDRASTVGELGFSSSGDFSATIDRLRRKQYTKILMREPFAPDSWYDHADWPASSGIRNALRENYREVRTIPEVKDELGKSTPRYGFRAISVLVPIESPVSPAKQ